MVHNGPYSNHQSPRFARHAAHGTGAGRGAKAGLFLLCDKVYGAFVKLGYSKMDGLQCKIQLKLDDLEVPPILGNFHLIKTI